MSGIPEPHRITIIVRKGFAEEVYTTLPMDLEVDVLDLDVAGQDSEEALTDMEDYLTSVVRTQKQIY